MKTKQVELGELLSRQHTGTYLVMDSLILMKVEPSVWVLKSRTLNGSRHEESAVVVVMMTGAIWALS